MQNVSNKLSLSAAIKRKSAFLKISSFSTHTAARLSAVVWTENEVQNARHPEQTCESNKFHKLIKTNPNCLRIEIQNCESRARDGGKRGTKQTITEFKFDCVNGEQLLSAIKRADQSESFMPKLGGSAQEIVV